MAFKIKYSTFKDASLLRKLSIFYFLTSVLPVSVLYYLYMQLREHGEILVTEEHLWAALVWIVIGVGVGYFALRSMVINVINLSKRNVDAIEGILGPRRLREATKETNDELVVLADSFSEITARLEENVRNLEMAKKTLHSVLARVGEGMASLDNIDSFLNLIIETVTEALQAKRGILLLLDRKKHDLFVATSFGYRDSVKKTRIDLNSSFLSEVLKSKYPTVYEDAPEGGHSGIFKFPLLCAPLILHEDAIGVIFVSEKVSEETFDDEEKNLMNNLALQTAVAVENARLNDDAEKTYFETISALALAVEAKDPYSRGHSDRVANLSVQVGEKFNLSQEDQSTIRDAAKLHDLGKIGITDSVLKKNGPLNTQESEMMKKHPEIGEGIIKPIRSLRSLADIVRHHHEKLDGTGYPDGLPGDKITLVVRILAVVDIYDALISDRPYRKAFSSNKALDELRSLKGAVDQKVVDVLAQHIENL